LALKDWNTDRVPSYTALIITAFTLVAVAFVLSILLLYLVKWHRLAIWYKSRFQRAERFADEICRLYLAASMAGLVNTAIHILWGLNITRRAVIATLVTDTFLVVCYGVLCVLPMIRWLPKSGLISKDAVSSQFTKLSMTDIPRPRDNSFRIDLYPYVPTYDID
jgi:hypothetical protein